MDQYTSGLIKVTCVYVLCVCDVYRYRMTQIFDRGNFDKFDESKLHRKIFPINILQ